MKITLLIVFLTNLFCTSIHSQSPDSQKHQLYKKHNDFGYGRTYVLTYRDENASYNMKLGDRGMPINTYNGQQPNKKQLEVIKNTLTEDFLVNDDSTAGTKQYDPSIAMNGLGSFVIVWADNRNDTWDIYYQLYNLNGIPQGTNTKVNDDSVNASQASPTIGMDAIGNFVIVWMDSRNGNIDIYFQRFDLNGAAHGINTKVNDDTGSEFQNSPSVSMNESGSFVIVWEDSRNFNPDIYFQRFNSIGVAQDINIRANDDLGIHYQYHPSVSMDHMGNFVIVWDDSRNGTGGDIYYQRYNSSGVAQGINSMTNDDNNSSIQSWPSISVDNEGDYVIVWVDLRNGNPDIFYQQYNSNGVTLGTNAKVNDDVGTAHQDYPAISRNGLGNFVIVWQESRNGNPDIYYQRYNSSGIPQGVNNMVNDDLGNVPQFYPQISMDGAGNFVAVWDDRRNLNDDIYYQRYNSNGIKQGINTISNNNEGNASQSNPSISIGGEGKFAIVWHDWRNGGGYPDIFCQRYDSHGLPQAKNFKVNEDVGSTLHWYPQISMDEFGNFVIVWWDRRNGEYNSDIYFQRYNSNGVKQGINTKVNDDQGNVDQLLPSIAMDGQGNFVIVWQDCRNGVADIYYQKYNLNGVPQGSNTRVNDDIGSQLQSDPVISVDGAGDFVVAWCDYRNNNYPNTNSDIYFQRYHSNGMAKGTNTKTNDDGGTTSQESPQIAMDGNRNFVIVWQDYRNENSDVYYQCYNSIGIAQGVNTKANDDEGNAGQSHPSISKDASGNFIIVWTDNRFNENKPDIVGQRFFADGSLNGTNYRIVADGPNHGETSPVVSTNNNKIIFSWTDNRRSLNGDIYAKIVGWDWNGVTSLNELGNDKPKEFYLFQNCPNPFNPSTKIKYAISSPQYPSLKVYDVLGNEVATLVDEYKPAGNYEVEFPNVETRHGVSLPSGVYFYQLRVGSFVETKKMILLR